MNAPTASGGFERIARERKMLRIVRYLDDGSREVKIDPHGALAALTLANMLKGYGEAEWQSLADAAEVNLPSERTRADVIAEYERRSCR